MKRVLCFGFKQKNRPGSIYLQKYEVMGWMSGERYS